MTYQGFLYIFLSLAAVGGLLILSGATLVNIKKPLAKSLFGLIAMSFWWGLFSFLEMVTSCVEQKLLFRNLSQIGVFLVPFFSYYFVSQFVTKWDKKRRVLAAVLFLVQVTSLVLIFTDGLHHLMRTDVSLKQDSCGVSAIVVEQTFLGMVLVSVNYLIMLLAVLELLIFVFRNKGPNRMQALCIMFGLLFPAAFGFLKTAVGEAYMTILPISVSFLPGSACIYWGFRKHNLISVSPIGRNRVFEVIREAVVILSEEGFVVDYNEMGRKFLELHFGEITANMVLEGNFVLLKDVIANKRDNHFEWVDEIEGTPKYYHVDVYVYQESFKLSGIVVILRDVTLNIKQQHRLEIQARTDGLTGILNRSAVVQKVQNCMKYPCSENRIAAFCVLDIDYFKQINDTYGHGVGDVLLQSFCGFAKTKFQERDVFGRLGGDEFCFLLNRESKEEIYQWIEGFVIDVRNHMFRTENKEHSITVSLGAKCILSCQEEFDKVYLEADNALYTAKREGRNKAVIIAE